MFCWRLQDIPENFSHYLRQKLEVHRLFVLNMNTLYLLKWESFGAADIDLFTKKLQSITTLFFNN